MNYRHIYHAGNFADVFKHIILLTVIESLHKKDNAILFLDTHAGIGIYHLTNQIARKSLEHKNGIARIYDIEQVVPIIRKYQQIIKKCNIKFDSEILSFYPGSPFILSSILRSQDNMTLVELHQEDVEILKRQFKNNRQIAIHHTDGYQSIKAFLPPSQGRGMILIDPPFEAKHEFQNIINSLKIAFDRFSHGIYLIWYPIKSRLLVTNFYNQIKNIGFSKILITEFSISQDLEKNQLTSCGMVIINPPWKIEQELQYVMSWLNNILAIDQTHSFSIRYLTS